MRCSYPAPHLEPHADILRRHQPGESLSRAYDAALSRVLDSAHIRICDGVVFLSLRRSISAAPGALYRRRSFSEDGRLPREGWKVFCWRLAGVECRSGPRAGEALPRPADRGQQDGSSRTRRPWSSKSTAAERICYLSPWGSPRQEYWISEQMPI